MKNLRIKAFLVLVVIGVIYLMAGLTTISPGEVGLQIKMLRLDRGMKDETLDTGMRWVDPIQYDVTTYDTRFKQYDDMLTKMESQTKDGQPIEVDISLQIGLIDEKVPYLHEKIGRNWYEEVVFPAVRSAVRNNTTSQESDTIYTAAGRKEIQDLMQKDIVSRTEEYGINVIVNFRDVRFTNPDFIRVLEKKASEAQNVVIQERQALAAEHTAIKMANLAEGKKQERIKAAEADREELKLKGQGERLRQEEQAKGILAIAKAKAEGTRLQVNAYGSGKTYASVKWAENLGPNVKVWGVPTGSPGTSSIVDLNGVLKGAFTGAK